MKFAKYQGLGNDFIILDKKIPVKEVIRLCDRKFGIGADGIIIHTIKNGLPFMDFYNADGTKAKMCGNGIRCYADYLDKLGMDYSKIDTLVGIKEIEKVDGLYKVSMGIPSIKFIDEKINNISINYLDSGTDHVIVYTSEKDMDTLKNMALEIQADKKLFPKGTNVNFVEIIDDKTISVITYERGVGFTLACGTGAVASAYLCKIKNLSKDKILVILKGGLLKVDIYENDVYMIGEARKVFEGEIDEQI